MVTQSEINIIRINRIQAKNLGYLPGKRPSHRIHFGIISSFKFCFRVLLMIPSGVAERVNIELQT